MKYSKAREQSEIWKKEHMKWEESLAILPLKENQNWESIRRVEDYDEKMIEDEKYMWYTQNMSRWGGIQIEE